MFVVVYGEVFEGFVFEFFEFFFVVVFDLVC